MNNSIEITPRESSQDNSSWYIIFTDKSPYFDGHFDDFSIVPALVQIHYAINLSKDFFSLSFESYNCKNLKFIAPITPNQKVVLSIHHEKEKNKINFSYTRGEILLSKGSVALCKNR